MKNEALRADLEGRAAVLFIHLGFVRCQRCGLADAAKFQIARGCRRCFANRRTAVKCRRKVYIRSLDHQRKLRQNKWRRADLEAAEKNVKAAASRGKVTTAVLRAAALLAGK